MPTFDADGVNIHYEVTGSGLPLVLSHEFAGDGASWEPQVNFFSRRYQVVTYSARGYLPSDVPEDPAAYSQERSTEDLRCLMDHLGIEQAYIGGLSMGGSVTVSFAIAHPERCRALIVAAAGAGADNREQMLASWKVGVETMLNQGMGKFAERYANGPERVQFKRKDPSGWQKFFDGLSASLGPRFGVDFPGSPDETPDDLPTGRGPETDRNPGVGANRRRGRPMRRPGCFYEGALVPERAGCLPSERPHHQPGRASPVQPHRA